VQVSTIDGVYGLARKASGEWEIRGRALEGVFVRGLCGLEDGTLIAATHGVGMALSADGGHTWSWIKGITQVGLWCVRGSAAPSRPNRTIGSPWSCIRAIPIFSSMQV
jgi:hypothetical protein